MGHCIPSLDLAKMLASHSLIVSFFNTRTIEHRLRGLVDGSHQLSAHLNIQLVDLSPLHAIEGLPEGCESMDLMPRASSLSVVSLVEGLREPFEQWVEEQGSRRPVCIISDLFVEWTVQSAKRFGTIRVIFAPCEALETSVFHAICRTIPTDELRKEDDCVIIDDILSSPVKFNKEQMPQRFLDPDQTDQGLKF